MIELNRTEWQIRCAFNAFCKRVLENEATNIYRERKKRQSKEMVFSDLTPQEEKQLYTLDEQDKDKAQGFQVAYVETSCGSHADIARRKTYCCPAILFFQPV
ncbi:hypothetical protein [Bacillus andreraoultii]|uniref:hypothetical protein n=1 Tax=Bacillus andreraoultii TaxID=1499685 RepID=UPI000B339A1D|nr:hypothetical protein [Bacillus andreraoultii]